MGTDGEVGGKGDVRRRGREKGGGDRVGDRENRDGDNYGIRSPPSVTNTGIGEGSRSKESLREGKGKEEERDQWEKGKGEGKSKKERRRGKTYQSPSILSQ